jgi:hypothetical protein
VGSNRAKPSRTVSVIASMNPLCTGQRSITLHSNASRNPVREAARHSSLRLDPVVLQENWGYWVKATARSTPSAFMARSASSLFGLV